MNNSFNLKPPRNNKEEQLRPTNEENWDSFFLSSFLSSFFSLPMFCKFPNFVRIHNELFAEKEKKQGHVLTYTSLFLFDIQTLACCPSILQWDCHSYLAECEKSNRKNVKTEKREKSSNADNTKLTFLIFGHMVLKMYVPKRHRRTLNYTRKN